MLSYSCKSYVFLNSMPQKERTGVTGQNYIMLWRCHVVIFKVLLSCEVDFLFGYLAYNLG